MSELITAKKSARFYAEIQQGAFIAAIGTNSPGFALYIKPGMTRQDLRSALEAFHAEYTKNIFQIKILSNIETIEVLSFFLEKNIPITKEIQTNEPFEIIFIPATSNLKIAKKSDAAATSNIGRLNQAHSPVVAIGSSTGGVEALVSIFSKLPSQFPPIVVAQHIPAEFSRSLSDRMNRLFKFEVKVASDGDVLRPNRVLIAPGGKHLRVKKDEESDKIIVSVEEDLTFSRYKPSVDILFKSVAEICGSNAIGIILTGMGDDGAEGLLAMKKKGAYTIGQNEETCVVYGMPRVAHEIGAVQKILPLNEIASEIIKQADNLKNAA